MMMMMMVVSGTGRLSKVNQMDPNITFAHISSLLLIIHELFGFFVFFFISVQLSLIFHFHPPGHFDDMINVSFCMDE